MQQEDLIPNLFRTEYSKIIAVIGKLFGLEHFEMAEDIVSDTFLQAAETWGQKGLPKNPVAWLYTVSKNKAIDALRHNSVFTNKVAPEIKKTSPGQDEIEIDLSSRNINDSQLQMMFAICHPSISAETQIGLSLNILCGFGAEEIAAAFFTNKETIYKRLQRGKDKLKAEKIAIALPAQNDINSRLDAVLTTLYLLFSEGYYSSSQQVTLRKELCIEAMRLNLLLLDNELTNSPAANALLALMCFHSSRFEARTNEDGELILYHDQDDTLWNTELIIKGQYYLDKAASGNRLSRYHIEAAIAYWHTHKEDTPEKWEGILQLYNQLLQIEYSPVAALNRTYALSKANSKAEAIIEAEKLQLTGDHLYHSLLGELYRGIDNNKALQHLQTALSLAKTTAAKKMIHAAVEKMNGTVQ